MSMHNLILWGTGCVVVMSRNTAVSLTKSNPNPNLNYTSKGLLPLKPQGTKLQPPTLTQTLTLTLRCNLKPCPVTKVLLQQHKSQTRMQRQGAIGKSTTTISNTDKVSEAGELSASQIMNLNESLSKLVGSESL